MVQVKNLREWQKSALKAWNQNNFQGIVEVATAGGKTFFSIQCILTWLEKNQDGKILVIVPTTALQDQWYVSLSEELNINASDICIWPEKKDFDCKFHIMVVNTARSKADLLKKKSKKLFLIADECHRYASIENSSALKIGADASLGLTATAEREYDEGLKEVLIPNLGKIIYKYGISDARKDGIVSEFEIYNVKVPFRSTEEIHYKKLTKSLALAFAQNDVEKISKISRLRARVSINATARIPAAVAIAEQNRGLKTLIFHEEIESAEKIFQILKKRGHSVAIYHSQIGGDARRESLKQFRKGIVQVIVCCRALDEGVDVPESEVAIIAASTSSSRQRIQRIGRVIRIHSDKERAKIYSIYITEKEQQRLREEQERLSDISVFNWFEMVVKNE
jgi:superfamily II DNA or RNA helicase